MGAEVVTFGCRLNARESEAIRGLAAGLEDTVIFNTCAVTAEAERQARQAIRRARRRRPGATIVVTGCAAQVAPDRWAGMDEVDRVLGNAEKLDPASLRPGAGRILVGDVAAGPARPPAAGGGARTRALLQVQQGCDHRCTFCIIPRGRGPNRSVPIDALARELRALVEVGAAEVVLTGVDIASYGGDLPGRPSLGEAVRRLLALVPDLARLRLSSIDPAGVDPELLRLFAEEPRLMPHLHLSVQAGDDLILKRMRRRHLRADVLALAERLRRLRPDIVLGADFIAGFPTETEAMFAGGIDLVERCPLTWLHVFPFSPRPGTPAARMPQLPAGVARERARRLREAGDARRRDFLESRVGRVESVVVEREGEGRSEQFAPVGLEGPAEPGTVRRARVRAVDGDRLVARLEAAA